ncbi:MAG TPA: glycosyltransferase [Chloroflexia bacterium]|nr:glycosyltransferase [Chloroflexia bacterium]
MNIILAGIMGRHPYGGVAWCSLMYLLGLRRLGHSVWYLEDTGECNYDPEQNALALNPSYALRFIQSCLVPYGLGERWCYIDYKGGYHGRTREAWRRVCGDADLFLDLSGGCWFWRDEYLAIPHAAFIDSDPAFTHLDIVRRGPGHAAFFEPFSALFTFGRNIGTPASPVPTEPLRWEHTWQPVCLDEWTPDRSPPRPCFTTVMTWEVKGLSEVDGNKDREFPKVLHLPSQTDIPLELAITGPREWLSEHGWRCVDAFSVSHNLDAYRDYIRSSMGEFSVAKHTYVATNSGWFSDRTECYLASGRPAVVQDTGFSAHLPTGEGLLAFRTADEALDGLKAVVANYERHAGAAREIARAHFAYEVVLPPLLGRATSKRIEPPVAEGTPMGVST